MRLYLALCGLAMVAGSAQAQQTAAPPTTKSDTMFRGDTSRVLPSSVTALDTAGLVNQLSGRAAAHEAFVGLLPSDTIGADTLRLTRDEAVAMALSHNPQIEVAREQVAEAKAASVQNYALPDPATSAYIINQAGAPSSKPIAANITIPFPDKFRLQYNIGTAGVKAAEYNYTAVRQQITSQTAQTYDTLRVALRHRGDLTESRALSADFLKKTQARFNAGTAARLDVVRAEVDLGQADNALLGNARDIANARASLNRLLGRAVPAAVAPRDTLAVPPPLPDMRLVEANALAARPELAGLRAQEAGAQASTTLAQEFWLPDLFFGALKDFGAPNSYYFNSNLVWQYGIQFPLPIFFFEHTSGEIAQSQHHQRELSASYRDMRAQVDQDVRAAYATAATALEQLLYLRDQVVPAAREAFHIASVSYGLGGSSALDVLDARRTLVDAESQYTDALALADASQADLERAAAAPLSQFRTGDVHAK
jgi:cobalt-zinc-cadmium efflux system outer membrane protein